MSKKNPNRVNVKNNYNFALQEEMIAKVIEYYSNNLTNQQIIFKLREEYIISEHRAKDLLAKGKERLQEHWAERSSMLKNIVATKLFEIADTAKATSDKLKALDLLIRLTGIAEEVTKIENTERKFIIEMAEEPKKIEDINNNNNNNNNIIEVDFNIDNINNINKNNDNNI
jgi:hypothetical protein